MILLSLIIDVIIDKRRYITLEHDPFCNLLPGYIAKFSVRSLDKHDRLISQFTGSVCIVTMSNSQLLSTFDCSISFEVKTLAEASVLQTSVYLEIKIVLCMQITQTCGKTDEVAREKLRSLGESTKLLAVYPRTGAANRVRAKLSCGDIGKKER